MARFKTPWDTADAKRRFELKRKQYEKLIHDVAKGEGERHDSKNSEKAGRISGEMGDLVRFVSDDGTERDRLFDKISALGRRYREAAEKGDAARVEGRNKEIARLRNEHRASMPDPHSYEGQLMIHRGRYGSSR